MKKYYLLQRIDNDKYFGSYRLNDFWCDDIDDAYKFDQNDNFFIDEQTEAFLKESDTYLKIIEIVKIG